MRVEGSSVDMISFFLGKGRVEGGIEVSTKVVVEMRLNEGEIAKTKEGKLSRKKLKRKSC